MKTTNIRELRHSTSTVLQWVAQGETVEITRRKKVVAVLSPPLPGKLQKPPPRDFEKDLEEIFGSRVFPTTGTDLLNDSRGDR